MVKSVECEDGSEQNIPAASLRWPDLAVLVQRAADSTAPMKRSVRPLFSVLLLIAFALTLICRILLTGSGGGCFFFRSAEFTDNVIVCPPPSPPAFNSTLLKYAAIEIGEEKAKQEIESLLEGKLSSNQGKSFANWRRFSGLDIRASRTSRGIKVLLRSPQFYRYWLDFLRVLQNWSRNRRFQPEIMDELVKLIKHPIDNHFAKYSSCAVVGNSGILLKTNFGALIDSHEVVIRLNNARIVNFEQFVGSKTNISFVNSNILHLCGGKQGCYCHPYGENVPIVMYVCQPLHLLDYTICSGSHKSPLVVTDARFDVLCSRIVKYYSLKRFAESRKGLEEWAGVHDGSLFHYSSGFQAVMLAAGVCERVSLFGFGKSGSAKHHYHTNQRKELSLHDYEAEYEFYRDLANNSKAIPFVLSRFEFPPVVIYR